VNKDDFLKLQYQTLREEIKETKARIFKITGFGVTIIPATQYIGQIYKVDILLLALPLLTLIVALIYISENQCLYRCGMYIRDHIEAQVPGVMGWEEWLQTPASSGPRLVGRYKAWAFRLLFVIYFLVSVCLASQYASSNYGWLVGIVVGIAYGLFWTLGCLYDC